MAILKMTDLDLADKLKDEWPGILRWAIEGCLEWQRIGLAPPPAVLAATESYLADEDAIGREEPAILAITARETGQRCGPMFLIAPDA